MKHIKKFNESFESDKEIDKFLTKIKDDCAEISDKFEVRYDWEDCPSLDKYIQLFKSDGNTLPFYINIFKGKEFKRSSENWNNRTTVMEDPDKAINKKLELLEYEMDFFKRIKHLVKTSDLYLYHEDFDRDDSLTLVADFKRKLI